MEAFDPGWLTRACSGWRGRLPGSYFPSEALAEAGAHVILVSRNQADCEEGCRTTEGGNSDGTIKVTSTRSALSTIASSRILRGSMALGYRPKVEMSDGLARLAIWYGGPRS